MSTATSSKRSFISRTFSRQDTGSDSSEDHKGPFGLSTLFDPGGSVVADLVFVHGLGGGSTSTWTKSGNPTLYWPREWLPQDPDFQDVRIHSFGYNSNWGDESTLGIHDFAKSLLGSLHDCPAIPRNSGVSMEPSVIDGDSYCCIRWCSRANVTAGSIGPRWSQHGWSCNQACIHYGASKRRFLVASSTDSYHHVPSHPAPWCRPRSTIE